MKNFFEYYTYLFDEKLKNNTLVILLISLMIIAVTTILPKRIELAYNNAWNYSDNEATIEWFNSDK